MLHFITATQAEADPVISALNLKRTPASLNYYQKEESHLVVSGIGKCNAAAACGWLAQKTKQTSVDNKTSVAWLNFGIAGHANAELGTAFLAHKITDLATERVWFPHRLTDNIASSDLTTVDKPLQHYRPAQLHDMEASAYTEAARRFSDAELVQAIKVVSDNETQLLSSVNARLATKLIENCIEPILHCVNALTLLSQTIPATDNTAKQLILDRWHFSASQAVQLERLLQRHKVLMGKLTDIPDSRQQIKTSKALLIWLQNKVDNADFTL